MHVACDHGPMLGACCMVRYTEVHDLHDPSMVHAPCSLPMPFPLISSLIHVYLTLNTEKTVCLGHKSFVEQTKLTKFLLKSPKFNWEKITFLLTEEQLNSFLKVGHSLFPF